MHYTLTHSIITIYSDIIKTIIPTRRTALTLLFLAAAMLPHGLRAQLATPYSLTFDTMTAVSQLTAQGFSYYGCTLTLTTTASCNATKQLRFSGGGTTVHKLIVK